MRLIDNIDFSEVYYVAQVVLCFFSVMSRSYKKHPSINCVCYSSNKKDKRIANRRLRRFNKQVIQSLSNGRTYLEDETEYFKILREVSNTYNFASDGLSRIINEYALIRDFSDPNYTWMNRNNYPITSINEARREHNWALLKRFIGK